MSRAPSPLSSPPERARFELGASPFRVKGVLYQGTQAFFEQNLQGGMTSLLSEIDDPALRAFIAQKFLPSGWYDVLPVPELIACEARALRMGLPEYLLHRTRYQAKRDLGGVYGWVLRLATPGLVATRLPKIMSQMFDFVRVDAVREDGNVVEVRFHGIPATLVDWLHNALNVYSETALKLAGARGVDISLPRARAEGEVQGVPTVSIAFQLTWE